ncbi:MAG: AarF/ABC1/UbiB kinase family protein [Deltaproteobacteria bacterium]|nr:AarF/ABC1/UbiB kinase family protein [Deltaproteobacteria bacterium]
MNADELRAALVSRLLRRTADLPTSRLARLARAARAALKVGRLAGRGGAQTPPDTAPDGDLDALAELVAELGQLKGIAMKAGQILSYVDLELPPALKTAFSVLQTHAPPMAAARVREIIGAELGPRGARLIETLEPEPLAAASIGQVHRARLADGTRVAVKVQYPEIEQALGNDFSVARATTRLITAIAGNKTPAAFAREVSSLILAECDYRREARMQQRFAAAFAGHPTLLIPAVHPELSARRVLTTTFVDGLYFDAWLAAAPTAAERHRVGTALFEFYIGSLYRLGLFNADPHPGNYLFLKDGRVAILDHGCVREFAPAFVATLARLSGALASADDRALAAVLAELGIYPRGKDGLASLRALFTAFYGPMLVDRVQPMQPRVLSSMRELLESKRRLLSIDLPGEFPFLLRIRFGLMSVLARIGAAANWYRLERSLFSAAVDDGR